MSSWDLSLALTSAAAWRAADRKSSVLQGEEDLGPNQSLGQPAHPTQCSTPVSGTRPRLSWKRPRSHPARSSRDCLVTRNSHGRTPLAPRTLSPSPLGKAGSSQLQEGQPGQAKPGEPWDHSGRGSRARCQPHGSLPWATQLTHPSQPPPEWQPAFEEVNSKCLFSFSKEQGATTPLLTE